MDELPEELSQIGDEKVTAAFHRLSLRHQKFVLHYLSHGYGAEAYRQAFNPIADSGVAATVGSRLLRNVDIKIILDAFRDHKDEDLDLIRKTYTAAANEAVKPVYGKDSNGQPEKIEDIPDYAIRIKAAEALARLHGANAAEKKEISGSVTIVSTPMDEAL